MKRRSNRVAPAPPPPAANHRPPLSPAATSRHGCPCLQYHHCLLHCFMQFQQKFAALTHFASAYQVNKDAERERVKLWLDSFDKVRITHTYIIYIFSYRCIYVLYI